MPSYFSISFVGNFLGSKEPTPAAIIILDASNSVPLFVLINHFFSTFLSSSTLSFKWKFVLNAFICSIKFLVNSSILLLAFAFLFVGLSLFLGYILGYNFLGFLIISGVLFLITLTMVIFGKPLFERRVLKMFNSIFSDLKK